MLYTYRYIDLEKKEKKKENLTHVEHILFKYNKILFIFKIEFKNKEKNKTDKSEFGWNGK